MSNPEIPNVQRLIIRRFSQLAIPAGCDSPLASGLEALANDATRRVLLKRSEEWVHSALHVLRLAYQREGLTSGLDDETLAGKILEEIESRKKK